MFFLAGIALLISCRKETAKVQSANFVKIDNGRLHFSSKTLFSKKIDEVKKRGEVFAANELAKFYNKGFYSLRPFISQNDEALIRKYEKRKLALKSTVQKVILDDLEDLIGDDDFAGFVNDNGEIEIGDSIYAYTNRGLFFSLITDSAYLHNYLEREVYNAGQLKQGNYVSPCEYAQAEGGLHPVDAKIMRFIQPVPEGGCSNSGGSNNDNTGTGSMETFNNFIQSLPECAYRPGTLDFLFGPSAICESYFDGTHRVKTKFWNQDYLVYKSIGISVKYQKKSLGIWWTTKTDEVGVGIKQAYFEYPIPIQNLQKMIPQLYIYDGKIYNSRGEYLSTLSENQDFKLPFTSSLEIVVNLPFYGIYENDISAKRLNTFFWKTIWNQAKSVLQKLDKNVPSDISLVGLSSKKFVVNYINTSIRKTNSKKIMKIFDIQAGFGFVLGDKNNTFAIKRITLPKFYDYTNIKIDVYGAARKGSVWKGSHLIYSD